MLEEPFTGTTYENCARNHIFCPKKFSAAALSKLSSALGLQVQNLLHRANQNLPHLLTTGKHCNLVNLFLFRVRIQKGSKTNKNLGEKEPQKKIQCKNLHAPYLLDENLKIDDTVLDPYENLLSSASAIGTSALCSNVCLKYCLTVLFLLTAVSNGIKEP